MATSDIYNADFFAKGERGMIRSAHAIVPVLYDMFKPASVIDVGCGEGWWLREFAQLGVKRLVGVEQNADAIAAGEHVKYDLAQPLRMQEKFDLCMCLEVAEHLPPGCADALVESLCSLSDTVVFSAAIPKQGGNGHLNEQWQSYWISKFNAANYVAGQHMRDLFWKDPDVEPWYAQNMLLFKNFSQMRVIEGSTLRNFQNHTFYAQFDVVHPRIWSIYRGG